MKKRTWYLMRHGETDLNKKNCFYGSEDVSINEIGVRQAQNLHDIMSGKTVTAVYTSELKRSKETAEIVFFEKQLEALSGFNERSFGSWEGMNADEIQAVFPTEWERWLESPFKYTPNGAEEFSLFQSRVWGVTRDLLKENENSNIAIVAHLGVLRLIYQYIVDSLADFWEIVVPKGTVLVLDEINDSWGKSYLGRSICDDSDSR